MKIHDAEKSIAHLMENKTTASLITKTVRIESEPSVKQKELFNETLKTIDQKTQAKLLGENKDHPDLMYGSAILVSTAVNLNDDVFLPAETWKARATPINQPYNDDHIAEDIIGHIIASHPVDKDGKAIADSEKDEIPEFFNLNVDFVIYKSIFPEIAKDIVTEGAKGKKSVSMEVRFKDFDYAIIESGANASSDSKSVQKTVNSLDKVKVYTRNDETAFLTKYLKAYGGEGKYKGQRIGRVLKDFRFDGMGSVDTPANPLSKFTELEDSSQYSSASFEEVQTLSTGASQYEEKSKAIQIYISKGNIMEIQNVDQAKSVIAELNAQLKGFQTKADEQAKASLEGEQAKAAVATQKYTEATNKITELTKTLETAQAALAEKTAQLEKIEKTAKASVRLAELKELGVEVTDEAKRVSYANLSDDAFASLIDFAKTFAKSKADMDAEAKDKKDKKDKQDEKDAKDAEAAKKKKDDEEAEAKKKDDSKDKKKDDKEDKKDNGNDEDTEAEKKKKAEAAAATLLNGVSAEKKSDVTRTAGNVSTDASELQKTSAKLIEVMRSHRKSERFGRKVKATK